MGPPCHTADMDVGSIFFALNMESGTLPDKIKLLPIGPVVKGQDGRTWLLSDPEGVLLATAERGIDLAIDVNHSTDLQAPQGKAAPAVGWVSKLAKNDAGEIWGEVAWTDEGKALVLSRAYRYISPVFAYDPDSREIQALIGAGLTNRPNLRLQALNQESTPAAKVAGITKEDISMKMLCAALGLPETATEAELVQAINAIKTKPGTAANAQAVDLAVYAPRADLALMEQRALNAEKTLADLKAGDLAKRSEDAVDAAIKDRKIAPASKAAYLAMCASEEGLKQFQEIAKTAPAIMPAKAEGPAGAPPETEAALNAEESAQAKSMGYSDAEWKKVKEASK